MRKTLLNISSLIVLVLFGMHGPARADQPRVGNLGDKVLGADAIVHARVLDGECVFEHGRIYTLYRLSPLDAIKGAAAGEVRVPGGELGLVAYIVPGAPEFRRKGEGVFFLHDTGNGVFELDGITTGVFRVLEDANGRPFVNLPVETGAPVLSADGHLAGLDGTMALRDFKAAVRGMLGLERESIAEALPLPGESRAWKSIPSADRKAKRTPGLAAGNVQAGYSRILRRPVDIFWDLSRDYGPVSGGRVKWYFNPDSIAGKSPHGVTPEQALEAAGEAFDSWQSVETTGIRFESGGMRTDIADHKLDLVNIVTFADSEYTHGIQKDAIASARPFALTRRTWVGPEGLDFDLDGRIDFPDFPEGVWEAGTIIDCDIRWDAGGPFADTDFAVDNTPNALSMQGVFSHEIGHFAGLVHTPIRDLSTFRVAGNTTPTMFSIAVPNPADGSDNPMNTLEFDDRISISMQYPAPSFAAMFGTIEGRVLSGLDGSPVQGNFVAALSAPSGGAYSGINDAYDRAETVAGVFTGLDGAFRIPGLPPGEYVLALQPMDDNPTGTNQRAFNTLVSRFGDTDYIWDEFHGGSRESATEEDPFYYETVTVGAGQVAAGVDFVTNTYPAGRSSVRRLFGERDYYVAANQLASPFRPMSSSSDLVARRLPQVFEPPYTVVSATCDFSELTAPPVGAQVTWPEIMLALTDPDDPSRPDIGNPLAVIRNFAGDGTLLSSDPLPFGYPVRVDRDGDLWVVVRSPEGRFNAYHNIDILGAGQDELQVDESFVSYDNGATWNSVMNYGVSWRMGVVAEGSDPAALPVDQPRLAMTERIAGPGGGLRLHFRALRYLSGEEAPEGARIRLAHTYNAGPRPEGSILRDVSLDPVSGRISFRLVRRSENGDSTLYRVRGFGPGSLAGTLTGTLESLSGVSFFGLDGDFILTRRSGSGTGVWDGLWSGSAGLPTRPVRMDLRTGGGGLPMGTFIWPAVPAPDVDSSLVFESEPGDTVLAVGPLPSNPAGFSLVAVDTSGRTSLPLIFGLGSDRYEPNGRIKDARPVMPVYGMPHAHHTLSAIRGTIFATRDADDADFFSFPVRKGDSVLIDLDAVSGRPFDPASSLDAYLELFDSTGARFTGADGRELLNDDNNGLDPLLTFTSWRSATCYLRVVDALVAYGERGELNGANAFYELRISLLPRKGDVLRDRVVSIDDVLEAMKLARTPSLADAQTFFAADMNGDNRVDMADVNAVFRRAVEEPVPLPPGGLSLASAAGGARRVAGLSVQPGDGPGKWTVRAGGLPRDAGMFMVSLYAGEGARSEELEPGEGVRALHMEDDGCILVAGSFTAASGTEDAGDCKLFTLRVSGGGELTVREASVSAGGEELDVQTSLTKSAPGHPAELPRAFSLGANHPNPFNPSTTIGYSVPESSAGVEVGLRVHDIRGRLVRVLVAGPHEPGRYSVSWDGTDSRGRSLPSGVYFYRLRAGGYSAVRKMVLVK